MNLFEELTESHQFDCIILGLAVLINLVEHSQTASDKIRKIGLSLASLLLSFHFKSNALFLFAPCTTAIYSKSALFQLTEKYQELLSKSNDQSDITREVSIFSLSCPALPMSILCAYTSFLLLKSTQDNVVAAYLALLLGCLCRGSTENQISLKGLFFFLCTLLSV